MLIFGVKKCACAIFHAFCKSEAAAKKETGKCGCSGGAGVELMWPASFQLLEYQIWCGGGLILTN